MLSHASVPVRHCRSSIGERIRVFGQQRGFPKLTSRYRLRWRRAPEKSAAPARERGRRGGGETAPDHVDAQTRRNSVRSRGARGSTRETETQTLAGGESTASLLETPVRLAAARERADGGGARRAVDVGGSPGGGREGATPSADACHHRFLTLRHLIDSLIIDRF